MKSLQNILSDSLQGIRSREVQVIRNRKPELLSYATAMGLEMGTTYIAKEDEHIGMMPLVNMACYIGKLIQVGHEAGLDERTRTLRRFKIGMHCLIELEKRQILSFYRQPTPEDQKSSRNRYYCKTEDKEFVDLIIDSIGLQSYTPRIHSEVIVNGMPNNWESSKDHEGGDLVRNCLEDSIEFNTLDNVPDLYKAINRHQKNKYQINHKLLSIATLLEKDEAFNPVIKRESYTEEKDYKRAVKVVESKQREYSYVLKRARRAMMGDYFTAYNFYDSRVGRLYTSSAYLNYGGTKLAKALHLWSEKKEIGKDGWFWLHVQIANCLGYDKEDLETRAKWVERNNEFLMQIAADPILHKDWWIDCDDPWGFIAALLELQEANTLEDPTKLKSGLMIALDATNSGLQILSAWSRDEKAGRLCNLVPSDKKGDFYMTIADNIYDDIEEDNFWNTEYLKSIRRKIMKRPSMTVWYGAGKLKIAQALISDWIGKKGFDGLTMEHAEWLADKVIKACKTELPGPAALMLLFQRMGMDSYNRDEDLYLTAPITGALFQMNARGPQEEGVDVRWTNARGKKQRMTMSINTIRYAKRQIRKTISASSPNIVHGMGDSQIVAWLLLNSKASIACIHDSFSTHLCSGTTLYNDTRAAMVALFTPDRLKEMLDEVGTPEYLTDGWTMENLQWDKKLKKRVLKGSKTRHYLNYGDLDINQIPKNEWCFS